MNHKPGVTSYPNHRPGLTYYRPTCSCGWYTKSISRIKVNAEQAAAAHAKRANAKRAK